MGCHWLLWGRGTQSIPSSIVSPSSPVLGCLLWCWKQLTEVGEAMLLWGFLESSFFLVKRWPWLVGYVGPHGGLRGWLAPPYFPALFPTPHGSSQTLGSTWGPEVLCPHTFLLDFCSRGMPGSAGWQGGERIGLERSTQQALRDRG